MITPPGSDILTSYAPTLISRRLASKPAPPTEPISESFPAALLFIDIAGLTTSAEALLHDDPPHIEELSHLLNTYFDQLIETITAHRGDVIKFNGNCLLALWPARPGLQPDEDDLGTATQRAAECGLAIQQNLKPTESAACIQPSLRLGVGTGQVSTLHLGGVCNRWEFVVTGRPLAQAVTARQQAQPGQVVVSAEAWSLIKRDFAGSALDDGNIKLEASYSSLPPSPLMRPVLPPQADAGLQAYLPGAILSRATAERPHSLTELRKITVLFVHLPELTSATSLSEMQRITRTLQTALYHYEGSVNRLTVDNSGATLIAALGLPPLPHKDDAARAVQAALAMQSRLQQLSQRCAIGIATGSAFCGPVGNSRRREYTIIGDLVDRAAHLMAIASQNLAGLPEQISPADIDSLLCDEATCEAAQANLSFDSLPPVQLTETAKPLPIYRPGTDVTTASSDIFGNGNQPVHPSAASHIEIMEERMQEKVALAEGLQALLRGKTRTTIILEGGPGVGKSRLVKDLLRQAEALGVDALMGAGDAIESASPYHAWRPIFAQLLDLDKHGSETQAEWVLNRLQSEPELRRLAPLLNVVLPLNLPENELTRQMTGQVRADNTHELLVHLLQNSLDQAPKVLIIEDGHWLDSVSWRLLQQISQDIQPLLLVIAIRPTTESLPVEYDQLINVPTTQRLKLKAFPRDDMLAVVCQRLGVASLPPAVAELIQTKAKGHPLFGEELAYTLRDVGQIDIKAGQCYLRPDMTNLNKLELPDTIEGIIAYRLDHLAPQQRLALKAASIIGPVFSFQVLYEVYPEPVAESDLAESLNVLVELEILSLEATEPEAVYAFQHTLTREVAYHSIQPSRRQRMHETLATWYEQHQADDLTPLYPRLAHHWGEADIVPKAIDYLEKAGEYALHCHANQEAIRYFARALSLVRSEVPNGQDGNSRATDQLRCAHWERRLGEAYLELDHLDESRKHLQRALALLGHSEPATRGELVTNSLGQLLQQLVHRLWPSQFVANTDKSATLVEATRASLHLARISQLNNEREPFIYTGLRTLNLAEVVGPSPELALAYATMCLATDHIHFHSLADAYRRRAWETAQCLNEPSTTAQVVEMTSIHDLGTGHWTRAQTALEQATDIFDSLGDQRHREESECNLATVAFHRGEFAQSAEKWRDLYQTVNRRGDNQIEARALNGQAENKLRQGHAGYATEAATLVETALSLISVNTDPEPEKVRAYGLLALAQLRQGDRHLAHWSAENAVQLMGQAPPQTINMLESYAGLAEVYLTLWEHQTGPDQTIRWVSTGPPHATLLSDQPDKIDLTPRMSPRARERKLKSKASQACKNLHQFADVFPIGQPWAWLWQGQYEWLIGQPAKAHKAWAKSLAAAERFEMPYEQGLIHYEIGRHLAIADPTRREHLTCAHEIFTQLDATYDLVRTQKALAVSEKRIA